jgi:HSP20 family protein
MARQEIAPLTGSALRPFFQARPFSSLQREIDRLFDDFGRSWESFAAPSPTLPKINVADSDGEIEITAELPGMEEKDVDISVSDGVLTLSGEKKSETERKEKDYTVSERSFGSFSRSLTLPSGIDPSAIKATMAKGVLKVSVPKPATAKPAKIEIKPSA